jgi:hypothetical protein
MRSIVAAAVLLAAIIPPYPLPKLIQPTDDLKCDWGTIESMQPATTQLILRAEAGPVTIDLAPGVRVAGPDGKELGETSALRAGQNIRVYYIVAHGAKAKEIDILSPGGPAAGGRALL